MSGLVQRFAQGYAQPTRMLIAQALQLTLVTRTKVATTASTAVYMERAYRQPRRQPLGVVANKS